MGETEVEVCCTVGVKQGDNLAPILFIIFMQAVLEMVLEIVHQKWQASKPSFRSKNDSILTSRSPILGGKHGVANGCVTFKLYRSFYADDGAFLCESREDILFGANLIDKQFRRFGLACHIGYDDKLSKTEALFIPYDFSKYEEGDTSPLVIQGEKIGYVYFCKKFKYLGSLITSSLTDDDEIERRITAASAAFASLRQAVFTKKSISAYSKKNAYEGLILSILLYGCEAWVLSSRLKLRLQSFHRRCVRSMSKVTILQTWQSRISAESLEKKFGLKPIAWYVNYRRLVWAGKVMRMDFHSRLPRKLLTSWISHKRPMGRPKLSYSHYLKETLGLILDPVFIDKWKEEALNETSWNKLLSHANLSIWSPEKEKKKIGRGKA